MSGPGFDAGSPNYGVVTTRPYCFFMEKSLASRGALWKCFDWLWRVTDREVVGRVEDCCYRMDRGRKRSLRKTRGCCTLPICVSCWSGECFIFCRLMNSSTCINAAQLVPSLWVRHDLPDRRAVLHDDRAWCYVLYPNMRNSSSICGWGRVGGHCQCFALK